jgi:hypothetical protein
VRSKHRTRRDRQTGGQHEDRGLVLALHDPCVREHKVEVRHRWLVLFPALDRRHAFKSDGSNGQRNSSEVIMKSGSQLSAAALLVIGTAWMPGSSTGAEVPAADPKRQDEIILARQALMEAISNLSTDAKLYPDLARSLVASCDACHAQFRAPFESPFDAPQFQPRYER